MTFSISFPVTLPLLFPLLLISLPFLLVARFLLNKFLQPYTTSLRRLQGPALRDAHWWWGSFDKETLAKSRMQHKMIEYGAQYGKIWSGIQPGRGPFVVLRDRKALQYCLLTKSQTYVKPPEALRVLSAFFGNSLLGVDGELHKKHRKVAFPPFTQQAVNNLAPCFMESGKAFVERWNGLIAQQEHQSKAPVPPQGHLVNAFSEFSRSALDIIGKAGFGYDFGALKDGTSNELYDAFERLFQLLVTGSLYSTLRTQADWVPTLGHFFSKEQKELEKTRKIVDDIATKLVNTARDEAIREGQLGKGISKDSFGKDLLSILVRSNLSTDIKSSEKISHQELIGFVPTFLSAGHETTATALSWSSYALSHGEKGLEIQRRLREELTANPDWSNDAQSISSLPYLSAFVQEVLRMYSPIRQTRRQATEDDVIPLESPITLRDGSRSNSFKISKGDVLYIPLHSLNVESDTWGDGETFRPERWLESDHQYFEGGLSEKARDLKTGWNGLQTFAVGPRNCIGMRMAILEISYVIANVVTNFQLNPPELEGEDKVVVEYRQAVVARPCVAGRESEGHLLPIRISKLH